MPQADKLNNIVFDYAVYGTAYVRKFGYQTTFIAEKLCNFMELGTGNATLCVFRTNDFRVGFITENAGVMNYVISEHTYVGQAMPPEYAESWPQDAKVWINNAQYYYPLFSEHGSAILDIPYLACYGTDTPVLAVFPSVIMTIIKK